MQDTSPLHSIVALVSVWSDFVVQEDTEDRYIYIYCIHNNGNDMMYLYYLIYYYALYIEESSV